MNPEDRRRRLLALLSTLTTSSTNVSGQSGYGDPSNGGGEQDAATSPYPPDACQPFASRFSNTISLSGTIAITGDLVIETPTLELPELPILVQSVVEVLRGTSEGSLITTVRPVWIAVIRALSRDPDALHKLTPRQLEELVAASYEQEGFEEVTLTPRSGDLGRDVIAVKRGFCTVRIIDQVKHYDSNRVVDANDVRALVGVLLSDERATKGFVTTSAKFAPGIESDPFIAKHVPYRLELVDGGSLLSRLKTHAN